MCNENTRAAVPEDRAAGGVQAFQWPNGTKPELHELLNGSLQIVDAVEDAPLLTITGHNGVDPRAFLNFLSGDVAARIVECARAVNAATFSHVDGRDLLAELHPRYEIDIKVRRDGQDRWYEGDWLSRVWDAIKPLRAALAAAPATEAATSAPEARDMTLANCSGDHCRTVGRGCGCYETNIAALREAYERGAADENARIYHTKEFGSGSSALPTAAQEVK